MDDQVKHLINENTRLKQLMIELVHEYREVGAYSGDPMVREYQPELIQRAMDAAGMIR